jgi:hypothetical protein
LTSCLAFDHNDKQFQYRNKITPRTIACLYAS